MKANTLRRAYLREAAVTLFLARVAVRVLPVAQIFGWADRPTRRVRRFAGDEVGRVMWAIDTAVAKSHTVTLCLPRALAAHSMLRRRGITSRVCLGVTRDHGDFSAHAWVEVGKNKIVHAAFKRLAEFGDAT